MSIEPENVQVTALGTNHDTDTAYFKCTNTNADPVDLALYSIEGVDKQLTVPPSAASVVSLPVTDHPASGSNRVAFQMRVTNASDSNTKPGLMYLSDPSPLPTQPSTGIQETT